MTSTRVTEAMRLRAARDHRRKIVEQVFWALYTLASIGLILYVYVAGICKLGQLLGWW
jgi:hypothetical protein